MTRQSISLYISYYNEPDRIRKKEIESAINQNINNQSFSKVYILNESGDLSFITSNKFVELPVLQRPVYHDFFSLILSNTDENEIHIIANSDILFDDSIGVVNYLDLTNTCLALSRWDLNEKGKYTLYDHNDSQDVWIFKGKITEGINGDFPIGVPRCDNRIMYELQQAGYKVINPAYSIRTCHLHAGKRQVYPGVNLPHFVPPPYRYLYPHNLYNLPRTLWFNLTHKCKLAPYRYDLKKINRWFIIKVVRRIWEVTTGRGFPLIGYIR